MGISRNPLRLIGRFDFLIFYRVGNKIFFRTANPHTRKRILKDPCFKKFRECSGFMTSASRIGSVVYKALPVDFREYWMYRAFVGEAMKMLKGKGMKAEEVLRVLWKTYVEVWEIKRGAGELIVNDNGLRQQKSQKIRTGKEKVNIRWKKRKTLPLYEASCFSVMRKGMHGARAPAD